MVRPPSRGSVASGRKAEWVLMMTFGLGLLGLVVFTQSHLSAVPMAHQQRGHGHVYRMRSALELHAVEDGDPLLSYQSVVNAADANERRKTASARSTPRKRNAVWRTDVSRHPTKLNVHLVCHSHHDPGWLKTYDQSFLGVRNDQHAHVGPHVSAVQYELDGIIHGLLANRDRKFVYGEISFFQRWYDMQEVETQERVQQLVTTGQLDFAGGGWVSNDEAICHYEDIIDQMTLGHRWLAKTFGYVVRQHWQLDTFGHSGAVAALSALSGMDSFFFSRLDKEDIELRKSKKHLEFIWRGSPAYGTWGDIWSYAMQTGSYYYPQGFSLGRMGDFQANADHIVDDANSTEPLNVAQRVNGLVAAAQSMAANIDGNDIMFTMGGDFDWTNAFVWWRNLDKLIHWANKDGRVNVMYSTPRLYADAKKAYNQSWPVQLGDMFPYGDCVQCYWTGYFTSRPSTKLLSRVASGYLRAARQLELAAGSPAGGPTLQRLTQVVALMQHHDAITGTDRFAVNQDYRKLLSMGIDDGHQVMNGALRKLLSLPAAGVKPEHCPLLNVSVCAASVESSARGADFRVLLYNSLAWERTEQVRVPVTGPHYWLVKDPGGKPVPAQAVPQSDATVRVVNSLTAADATFRQQLQWVGDYDLVFVAKVPPLGYATYSIERAPAPEPVAGCTDDEARCSKWAADGECGRNPAFMHAACSVSCAACPRAASSTTGHHAVAELLAPSVSCTAAGVVAGDMRCSVVEHTTTYETTQWDDTRNETVVIAETVSTGNTTVISNGVLELTLETDAEGDSRLTTLRNPGANFVQNFMADMVWYTGGRHPSQPPWVVRPSGQYIFHPTGPAQPLRGMRGDGENATEQPVTAEVLLGGLVAEVRQQFSPEAQLTTRLYAGADYVEMEWTVGPLTESYDVSVSVETDIDSGDEFFTDANSLQMVRRVRGGHSSYAVMPLKDEDMANPIGGNYFPITSAMYLRDSATGRHLTLITDRGQGGSSMRAGQLEVMVNRRTGLSDELGNPEKMDESEGGKGVIARGTVRLSLQPAASAAKHRRMQAARLAWPLLPVFLTPAPAATSSSAPEQPPPQPPQRLHYSMLRRARALPPQVHLLSLYDDKRGAIILRLAHIYEAGEDERLAIPVKVDLAKLFLGLEVSRLQEVSLTGSHAAAQRTWPNRDWAAGAPFFNIDPDLAAEVAQNENASIVLPDGFNQQGEWVGLENDETEMQGSSGSAAGRQFGAANARRGGSMQFRPSSPLEDYSADERSSRNWFSGSGLIVELQPLEIRTFELTLRRVPVSAWRR